MVSMMSAKLRLVLAIVLFGVWMGWLIRLALTAGQPAWPESTPNRELRGKLVVLSRPQFLVSNLDVVAYVKGLTQEVSIREVLWPRQEAEKWLNKTARIANLRDCEDTWSGEGNYIIPLMLGSDSNLQVAPIPRSPGSPSFKESKDGQRALPPLQIYPDSPETRRQALEIMKASGSL
jgi:hypothetical protein